MAKKVIYINEELHSMLKVISERRRMSMSDIACDWLREPIMRAYEELKEK